MHFRSFSTHFILSHDSLLHVFFIYGHEFDSKFTHLFNDLMIIACDLIVCICPFRVNKCI